MRESTMQAGDAIGPYELDTRLGEGSTAEVWRAHHLALKTDRALKFLTHPAPEARRRMILEAQQQAQVVHPNVVRVHDVFQSDGRLVMAMELVEGQTLADWALQPRPPELIRWVLGEALTGLAALHAAGLIHRDLKPANLLIDHANHVRITDLGLARPADGNGTRTGALMGTAAYMAPEQTDDATAAEVRSDLFAMGVVALELVLGYSVFGRDTLRQTLLAIHDCDTVLAELDLPDDPELQPVIAFIRATVQRDIEARPESALACLDLLGFDPSQTLYSPPPSPRPTPPPRGVLEDPVVGGTLGALSGGSLAAGFLLVVALAGLTLSRVVSTPANAEPLVQAAPIEDIDTGGIVGPPNRIEQIYVEVDRRRGLGRLFKKDN